MAKRTVYRDSRQIDLFTTPVPIRGPGAHAGIEKWVSTEVSLTLKGDARSRDEIAGAMSETLGGDVSRWMLDAYASQEREGHNIGFGRAVALMAVTANHRLIEGAVHRLGGRILWGKEINTARLGHLQAQRDRIDAEIRLLRRDGAQPIERSGY
ncbi:MAG: hypothetical protein ACOY45_08395 [Pseudomonadota bacterium]